MKIPYTLINYLLNFMFIERTQYIIDIWDQNHRTSKSTSCDVITKSTEMRIKLIRKICSTI